MIALLRAGRQGDSHGGGGHDQETRRSFSQGENVRFVGLAEAVQGRPLRGSPDVPQPAAGLSFDKAQGKVGAEL